MIIFNTLAIFYIAAFCGLVISFIKVCSYDFGTKSQKNKTLIFVIFSLYTAITSSFLMAKIANFFTKEYHFPSIRMGFDYFENYHTAVYYYIADHYLSLFKLIVLSLFIMITIHLFIESMNFLKHAKKVDLILEKYELLSNTSFSVLTFGLYPALKGIAYLTEQKKIGTFRLLEEGNEVIRDVKKSEKRLRSELLVRVPNGFRFYKELRVPKNIEVLNTLIVGGMGSGKTAFIAPITLQFFENKYKSVIIDNKGDFCQLLSGKSGVTVFSPFDARSPVWNVAEDIETELEAMEFVAQLIPIHGGANDFFPLAARDITLGAVKFLQNTKSKNWNMNEVLETIAREDFLTILKDHHSGGLQTLKDSFEKDGKIVVGETSVNIFQNVRASLKNFEILSKAWPITVGGFSVKKWVREESKDTLFLIVPFKQIYPEISGFFSGIIIDSFLKECLNLSDSRDRRMGLFLDELGAIPRINTLANGAKLLRSKGLCMFVGIQEVGVIRKKYDQDGGTEVLINGFSTKMIGRAETPEYAEYFVRMFGKNRYKKITRNRSLDSRGRSSISSSQEEVVEDAILSGELLSIPPASLKGGAVFYVKTSEIPAIFKLKFPIIPLERPYPDSVEAEWLKKEKEGDFENTKKILQAKIDFNIKNTLIGESQVNIKQNAAQFLNGNSDILSNDEQNENNIENKTEDSVARNTQENIGIHEEYKEEITQEEDVVHNDNNSVITEHVREKNDKNEKIDLTDLNF